MLPKGVRAIRVACVASSADDDRLAIFLDLSSGEVAVIEMSLQQLAELGEVVPKYIEPFHCTANATVN